MYRYEASLVETLLRQADEHAKQHNATSVSKIVVKVGELSGIDIPALQRLFLEATLGTICEEATLEIQPQEVILYCRDCHQESHPTSNDFTCPHCQSPATSIVDGEEVYLMSLEMEGDEE